LGEEQEKYKAESTTAEKISDKPKDLIRERKIPYPKVCFNFHHRSKSFSHSETKKMGDEKIFE